MRRALLLIGYAALALPLAAQAAPAATWTTLADCAAAYQANARLADPDRSASMTAQISEVAADYARAAASAYRKQGGRSGAHRARAVADRIARRSSAFAARPRGDVERLIDACPEIED